MNKWFEVSTSARVMEGLAYCMSLAQQVIEQEKKICEITFTDYIPVKGKIKIGMKTQFFNGLEELQAILQVHNE